MIFYPDIIALTEKHFSLKAKIVEWYSNSGGRNLYIDLEFHPDDEMRKACEWSYNRFRIKDAVDKKSFTTIKVASFLMMTPNKFDDDAFLVNRLDPNDPDAYIRVNVEFDDDFVCTKCAICRTIKEVDDAVCKVEGRLMEIRQKYKKHLIEEAANAYTV